MTQTQKNQFEELNMTRDEIDRFTEAMKKEEFRKLLVEYAEEISDPKNRQLYEQEIAKLEEERGMNVTFIHPEPGYCIKTTQNGDQKCFINICKNPNLDRPTSKRDTESKQGGLHWQIPHTVAPPREDVDKSGKTPCVVYDVVFHPDAYRMGETNQRFNQLLKDSAMDTIEKNFGVKLDKVNSKVLKNLNFKGTAKATVIRKPSEEKHVETSSSTDDVGSLVDQLKKQYLDNQMAKTQIPVSEGVKESDGDKYTKPSYKTIHRGQTDMQDYACQLDTSVINSTRPKELFISIELPLCKSAEKLTLDIFEKRLYLESNNPNYKLDLNLSYPVNEKESKAKFDKSKRCLNVTLPVVPFVAKLMNKIEVESDENEIENEFSPSSLSCSSTSSLSSSPAEQDSCLINSLSQDIKYMFPSKFILKEFKDLLSIKLTVPSFDFESIRLKFESTSTLRVTCESSSSSGSYTQYFLAYFEFSTPSFIDPSLVTGFDVKPLISTNKLKILGLSDECFEIRLFKTGDVDLSDKNCVVSSQDLTSVRIEISQEFVDEIKVGDDEKSEYSHESQRVNKMSKKEFILNFDKIVNANEDDDDVDDVNDREEKSNFYETLMGSKNLEKPDRIDEEPETDQIEKEYLEKNDSDEDKNDSKEAKTGDGSSLSSSTTDFSSSLNSSSFSKIKSILKKPRSMSESSFNVSVTCSNGSNNDVNCDECSLKKSVSFNKQVVKNVFKTGSTICGMRKPGSGKNKKKNKRKRTVSDPSHNADNGSNDFREGSAALRSRSVSESSEDSSGALTNSADSLNDVNNNSFEKVQIKYQNRKKGKKNSKVEFNVAGKSGGSEGEVKKGEKGEKNPFDMETMIQWKNEGRLPVQDPSNNSHVTNCAFKFKNKLMNDLD